MTTHVIQHPLIKHKLGYLRDTHTKTDAFRALTTEISTLLAYEATRTLTTQLTPITTWNQDTLNIERVKTDSLTVVPILRAGLGMVSGITQLIPNVSISVIGLYRNPENLKPTFYFDNLVGNIHERTAIILDPILATGGSMMAAIKLLKEQGCKKIIGLSLLCVPDSIKKLEQAHPDVDLYVAAQDDNLNSQGYIIPGLGDAGDRLFGTR